MYITVSLNGRENIYTSRLIKDRRDSKEEVENKKKIELELPISQEIFLYIPLYISYLLSTHTHHNNTNFKPIWSSCHKHSSQIS